MVSFRRRNLEGFDERRVDRLDEVGFLLGRVMLLYLDNDAWHGVLLATGISDGGNLQRLQQAGLDQLGEQTL